VRGGRADYRWQWTCVKGYGHCDCLGAVLDSGRRIATRRGLEHFAKRIHTKRHPAPTREPEWEPEPRPLARVIPFRPKPAPEPATEPAPGAQELEQVVAQGRRINPQPHRRGRLLRAVILACACTEQPPRSTHASNDSDMAD
jgi:hypothetical protein